MIERIVAKYIAEHNMLSPADKIIVGLSGGADSVALLLILKKLGYDCIAAHCNFHLRGEEANRDEDFVVQLCKKQNITLRSTHFNTYKYAKTNRLSIEMAARELRYNWFNELILEENANKLAIAHHRDDNIETLFLNLARGAGLKGLTGIQAVNGYVIRPLLNLSRTDIEKYLHDVNQPYVTDSTNLEDEFARNKVRLKIIPMMEQINSACQQNIQNTIEYLNEVQLIYQKSITESISRVMSNQSIHIQTLKEEIAPQTILYEISYPLGFNSSQIKDMMESIYTSETKEFFSNSHIIRKERDYFYIKKKDEQETINIKPQLSYTTVFINKNFKIPKDKDIACFDADLIDLKELTLRKWQHADFFIPFGMTGKKNISDFFTDSKFTTLEKSNQWLLTHKEDIIWIIGQRTDNRYRITKYSKRALIVKKQSNS